MKSVTPFAIVFSLLLVPTLGYAEAPKRAPDTALGSSLTGEARRAYDEARSFYAQGEFARALDALDRAHRLSSDPRLLWNIAACERKLGRYARAMRQVERYRSAAATLLSESEKREADDFLSAAAAYVGTVDVASNVDGTEIFVDEELLGTTPLPRPIVVDEGEHRLRFARGGYRTVERGERVPAGARLRWVVELEREAATTGPSAPASSAPVRPPIPDDAVRSSRSPSRLGPLVLGGSGIVAGGVGTLLVLSAREQANTLEADCGSRCPPARWETEQTKERIGGVLLGVGAAAVVGAIVWWVLQPRVGERTTAGRAWIAPSYGGVGAFGAW